MARWQDIVVKMKTEQWLKPDVLAYVRSQFAYKNLKFTPKHKLIFERAWETHVVVNPTIEDIVPEVELPKDLTKMDQGHKTRVINILKRKETKDINRIKRLIDIGINLAAHRNKKRDLENFKILSDMLYEAHLIKKQGAFETSNSHNRKIETAGVSDVLYHATTIEILTKILEENKIRMSIDLGTESKLSGKLQLTKKFHPYYLSDRKSVV